jgi:hypothetical protein
MTTVLMGPSGSGKTTIIHHIMRDLHGLIDQALIISPTADSNKAYEGFVPRPLIHTSLSHDKVRGKVSRTLELLTNIVRRQKALMDIYKTTSKIDLLQKLYARCRVSQYDEIFRKLDACQQRAYQAVEDEAKTKPDIDKRGMMNRIRSKIEVLRVGIYRKVILANRSKLDTIPTLTPDERLVLKCPNLNPRLLLVFDDCSAELKQYFGHDVFRILMYQGRQYGITILFSCQSDTDMPVNLRQNAYATIFTTSASAFGYFRKETNKISSKVIRSESEFPGTITHNIPIEECISEIFSVTFRVLIYMRDNLHKKPDVPFLVFKADVVEAFMFVAPIVSRLCSLVQVAEGQWETDNPFYDKFKKLITTSR